MIFDRIRNLVLSNYFRHMPKYTTVDGCPVLIDRFISRFNPQTGEGDIVAVVLVPDPEAWHKIALSRQSPGVPLQPAPTGQGHYFPCKFEGSEFDLFQLLKKAEPYWATQITSGFASSIQQEDHREPTV